MLLTGALLSHSSVPFSSSCFPGGTHPIVVPATPSADLIHDHHETSNSSNLSLMVTSSIPVKPPQLDP